MQFILKGRSAKKMFDRMFTCREFNIRGLKGIFFNIRSQMFVSFAEVAGRIYLKATKRFTEARKWLS